MLKGSKMSMEQREKLRIAHLGKRAWNKGIPMSQEQRLKLTGKKHSDATKAKLRKSSARRGKVGTMLGKHLTPEQKQKVSEASKKAWTDTEYRERQKLAHRGKLSPNKGKKFPQYSGVNHPNWKGGTSFEPYPTSWTETFKRGIKERDSYSCRLCARSNGMDLHVHHIDYDKKNCNPNNLVTLCNSCHSKTNANREYWKSLLFNLIQN